MGELIKPTRDFLGRGLITPLRRLGPADFSSGAGILLVRSCIRQIISTRRGELPWKPQFGTLVDRMRHKINNEALETAVASDLMEAITAWEPRVNQVSIAVKRSGNMLVATIDWAIISTNIPGNQVVLGPDTFEVPV